MSNQPPQNDPNQPYGGQQWPQQGPNQPYGGQQWPQQSPNQPYGGQPAQGGPQGPQQWQPGPQGPQLWHAGMPPQQPPRPPKKHTGCKIFGSIIGGLIILIVIISVATSGGGDGTADPPASAQTSTGTDSGSSSKAPAPKTSSHKKAAPPKAKTVTLIKASGSAIKNTDPFEAPDEWTLKYSFDCSNFGTSGNFQVYVYDGGDLVDVSVNELKDSGKDSTRVYDGGHLHLQINSECDWTVKATAKE